MKGAFELRDHDKFHFWNTAPPDPIAAAKLDGRVHHCRATKGSLFPQSAMPLGEHTGKIMERVPVEYYRWLQGQKWFATAKRWAQVRDYMERFPVDG